MKIYLIVVVATCLSLTSCSSGNATKDTTRATPTANQNGGKSIYDEHWKDKGLPEIPRGTITDYGMGNRDFSEHGLKFGLRVNKPLADIAEYYLSELEKAGWETKITPVLKPRLFQSSFFKGKLRISIVSIPSASKKEPAIVSITLVEL